MELHATIDREVKCFSKRSKSNTIVAFPDRNARKTKKAEIRIKKYAQTKKLWNFENWNFEKILSFMNCCFVTLRILAAH